VIAQAFSSVVSLSVQTEWVPKNADGFRSAPGGKQVESVDIVRVKTR
jgi:hypothetical protein